MKYWPGWLLLKSHFQAFSVITSGVNISCREQVFWPTKDTGGLQHHKFLNFEGKHHPKNIWFHGCWNHPWLLFLNSGKTENQELPGNLPNIGLFAMYKSNKKVFNWRIRLIWLKLMRQEKPHTKYWNDLTPWRLTYSES